MSTIRAQNARVQAHAEMLRKGSGPKNMRITNSDIEDMFTPAEFVKLYNNAFGTSLKVSDLTGRDRIIDRISRAEGNPFTKHGKPADALLRDPNRSKFHGGLSSKTLDRFENLFKAVNATLSN